MKETGIIMSGNHPALILDGTKTMTRRVIKPQPIYSEDYKLWLWQRAHYWNTTFAQETWLSNQKPLSVAQYCPYGQVGDRLWVRETVAEWQGTVESVRNGDLDEAEALQYIIYKAGAKNWSGILKDKSYGHPWNIRPSIHMPKWACRIWLEITEVRVESLQEISKMDAKSEGSHFAPNYLSSFQTLWDSLNAKRGYGWEVNPWVWVILFNMIKTPGSAKADLKGIMA